MSASYRLTWVRWDHNLVILRLFWCISCCCWYCIFGIFVGRIDSFLCWLLHVIAPLPRDIWLRMIIQEIEIIVLEWIVSDRVWCWLPSLKLVPSLKFVLALWLVPDLKVIKRRDIFMLEIWDHINFVITSLLVKYITSCAIY